MLEDLITRWEKRAQDFRNIAKSPDMSTQAWAEQHILATICEMHITELKLALKQELQNANQR